MVFLRSSLFDIKMIPAKVILNGLFVALLGDDSFMVRVRILRNGSSAFNVWFFLAQASQSCIPVVPFVDFGRK